MSAPDISLAGFPFQVGDDDFDVVLLIAIELLERIDAKQPAIGPHQLVALLANPFCNRFVMTFARANQRGAQVKVFGFFAFGPTRIFSSKARNWLGESGVTGRPVSG